MQMMPRSCRYFQFSMRSITSPQTLRFLSNVSSTNTQYIHPLSQLVLEYLQTEQHHWVEKHGLDTGLKIESDGTFVIKFPSYEKDKARIWTSFDKEEKKHWLAVHKGDLAGRFLLQDNMKPAWNDGKSTPEKIRIAVDHMIEKIDMES